MISASELIKKLNLEKHVEGGYFKRVYESPHKIHFAHLGEKRPASSAIHFLLEGDDFSAFHRLKSDEIWSLNYGSSLTIYVIDQNAKLHKIQLGDPKNLIFQVTIHAGQWFAAEVDDKSSFSLLSCFVSPGFEYKDFELADRNKLMAKYPQYKELINRFTRIKK